MSNFPSKWFDFTTNKEIKRIRKEINSTLALKIEVSTSIILTIIAFCFSEYIHDLDVKWQVTICAIMSFTILLIFFTPNLLKWISIKQHGNIIIKGKDAVSVFDDEIVYCVLVAAEYYNSIENIKQNKIESDLKAFYNIEIQYYLNKSIDDILAFNSNYTNIFGNKQNQIPLDRLKNILDLINSIITSSGVKILNSKTALLKGLYDYFF